MKLILLILFLIISVYFYINKKEPFTSITNNKLLIKKTNIYKLVTKKNDMYVWEPNPIDNYFPLGQIITSKNNMPEKDVILVNSNIIKLRPIDYTLISMTDEGYGVWRAICPNNWTGLSDIISKTKPSKNRIKIIPKNYLEKSTVSDMNITYKSNVTKGFVIWNINKSDYFYCSDLTNKSKNGNIYCLNNTKLDVEKKMIIKNTKKYKQLYVDNNYSLWRPIPDKNYKILGDIILDSNNNPNNKINTITVYKKFTKPIIDYNEPLINLKKVSYWKPKCADSYTTLGDIVSLEKKEPLHDDIFSIPLEYTLINDNCKQIDNSLNKKYSIWSNNNYCMSNNKLNKPKTRTLNMDYCIFEKDTLDVNKEMYLSYNSLDELILSENLSDFIRESLSQRTGVPKYRFQNIELLDNKIKLIIESKPLESNEFTINKIIEILEFLISKENLTFTNNTTSINITDIDVNFSENENQIKINNDSYLEKQIKIN